MTQRTFILQRARRNATAASALPARSLGAAGRKRRSPRSRPRAEQTAAPSPLTLPSAPSGRPRKPRLAGTQAIVGRRDTAVLRPAWRRRSDFRATVERAGRRTVLRPAVLVFAGRVRHRQEADSGRAFGRSGSPGAPSEGLPGRGSGPLVDGTTGTASQRRPSTRCAGSSTPGVSARTRAGWVRNRCPRRVRAARASGGKVPACHRQAGPEQTRATRTRRRRGMSLGWALLVAGLLVIGGSAWVGWRTYEAYIHLQAASNGVSSCRIS